MLKVERAMRTDCFLGTSGICVEEDPISLFDRASPVRCAGETPTIPADVLSE